jgi:hypothetical protein
MNHKKLPWYSARRFGYHYMPYCIEQMEKDFYAIMGRGYKPIGTGCGFWLDAEISPMTVQIPDLLKAAKHCFHNPERLPDMAHFNRGCEDFDTTYLKRLDAFGSLTYIDANGNEGLIRDTFYPREIHGTNDSQSYVVNAKDSLLGVDPNWSSGGCGQLAFTTKSSLLYLCILNEKWLDIPPSTMRTVQQALKRPVMVEPLEAFRRWDAENKSVVSSFGVASYG